MNIILHNEKTEKAEKNEMAITIQILNNSGIICSSLEDIDGIIISRDILLNKDVYEKLKLDIPKLKPYLSSTIFTSVHDNAATTQCWPLINLVRQILRKYNYELVPKRICNGYTKDGIKKYKRIFKIVKLPNPSEL